jgi:uncharacterized membrane protein YgcG
MIGTAGRANGDAWSMETNGFLSTMHTFLEGPAVIVVSAMGVLLNDEGPHMSVRVGATEIGDATVTSTEAYADYTFSYTAAEGQERVIVAYDNEDSSNSEDRNLLIDSITIQDCTESSVGTGGTGGAGTGGEATGGVGTGGVSAGGQAAGGEGS